MSLVTILHPCQDCGTLYEFSEDQVSSTTQCKECGTFFRVQNRFLKYWVQSRKQASNSHFYPAIDLETKAKVLLYFPPRPVLDDPDYRAWLDSQAIGFTEYEHPHAARYLGMAQANGHACLVWEDADGGTLAARLKKVRRLPETEVLKFGLQIAFALKVADDLEYFHGGISASHILFDSAGNALLAGLGFPFPITEETMKQDSIYYLAPECLEDIGDARSDIFGLGACMFHALTGYPPMAASPDTHIEMIVKLKRTAIPLPVLNPPLTDLTVQLLRRMLMINPDQRLVDYDELIELLQAAQSKAGSQSAVRVPRAAAAVRTGARRGNASLSGRLTDSFKRLFEAKKAK